MKHPYWFVNYANHLAGIRTTETKLFQKLSDAKEFAGSGNKSGFIIRQDAEGNSLHIFFGNFQPSAQQQQIINSILEI